MAIYRPNNIEFGKMMKSDMIGQYVKDEAERLAAHLRATAPRGTEPKSGNRYADNFRVETGLDIRKRDRSAAFVINDSRYAVVLEVGSWNIKNPPAPMTKVLDAFQR
jgi:hypothetical protein